MLNIDHVVKNYGGFRLDVTMEVKPGCITGLVGRNGAGKSTLLKAISGIMEPTEGTVERQGSIAALLELASGFDGDLTLLGVI